MYDSCGKGKINIGFWTNGLKNGYFKAKDENGILETDFKNDMENGLLAIATPIYDSNNKLLAGMTLGTYMSDENSKYLKEFVLPILLNASNKATEAIKLLKY